MGLFGKKKPEIKPEEKGASPAANGSTGDAGSNPSTVGAASGATVKAGFEYSPDKAERFFDRAQSLHDVTNYAYSMNLWLGGLKQDPTSMKGLEGFVRAAQAYVLESKAKGPPKDTAKNFADDRSELGKYLSDLLQWGSRIMDAGLGVRAMQSASKLGLQGPAVWIAERARGAATQEKRPRKEYLVAVMEVFEKFQQFDQAVVAGEAAVRMDPTDGRLAQRVKNISAESTMQRGGFDQTGQAGGYRQNVRNTQKQQDLEDEERVVKTEQTLDRLIEKTRIEHEANPADRPTINKYGKFLLERAHAADEETAHTLYSQAFESTREFRFKEQADTIRLRQARRRVAALEAAAKAPDAGEGAKEAYKGARLALLREQSAMLEEQVAAYPTDLNKKYDLGRAYFGLQRYDDAVAMFQEAKADPKNRARVLNYLGLSFHHMTGYTDEAIQTLREALESHDTHADEIGTELRYGLMLALETRARESLDLANAEEAFKIASGITIQSISYRDVRKRRDDLKALLAELRSGGGAQG